MAKNDRKRRPFWRNAEAGMDPRAKLDNNLIAINGFNNLKIRIDSAHIEKHV